MGNTEVETNHNRQSKLQKQKKEQIQSLPIFNKRQNESNEKEIKKVSLNNVLEAIISLPKAQKNFNLTEHEIKRLYQESENSQQIFFAKLQEKISELYIWMSKIIIQRLNDEEMTQKQAKIFVAQEIISTSMSIFRVLGDISGFKFNNQILQQYNQLQISMIKYIKTIYSRVNKSYVPIELMKQFKNFDMVEQPEFDILRNMKVYYGVDNNNQIIKTLKIMLNKIMNELDDKEFQFQGLLQQIFSLKDKKILYQVYRRIPENVPKFDQDSDSKDQFGNSDIIELIYLWVNDMQDYLLDPSDQLLQKDYYKFIANERELIFRDVSPQQMDNMTPTIKEELEKHLKDYQTFMNTSKTDLDLFNRNIIKILTLAERNQKFVSKKDAQIIKYAVYNTNILSWFLIQKLLFVIIKLIRTGSEVQHNLAAKMDLIKLNVTDFFSTQVTGNKAQILQIFTNMRKLEEKDKIKIVKIQNNLGTPYNNVKICFIMSGCFLFCEITLALVQFEHSLNKQIKNLEFLNRFYTRLEKSEYGVIYELAIIIGATHNLINYHSKLSFQQTQIDIEQCKIKHPNQFIQTQVFQKPFVCSKCADYYTEFQNQFKTQICKYCAYYICSKCIYGQNKEQKKQKCLKYLQKIVVEEMINIEKKNKMNLLNADVQEKKSAHNYAEENSIKLVFDFYKKGKFVFLKDCAKKQKNKVYKKQIIEIVKKQSMAFENVKSVSFYATIGIFKAKKLQLYSVALGQNNLIFNFGEKKHNAAKQIKFNQYDFIIYHNNGYIIKGKKVGKQQSFKIASLYQFSDGKVRQNQMLKIAQIKLKNLATVQIALDWFQHNHQQSTTDHRGIQKNSCKYSSITQIRLSLPDILETKQTYYLSNTGLQASHLKYFSEISWKNKVKIVNLSNNLIKNVGVLFQQLINIETALICDNLITQIEFTKPLLSLTRLNCSYNSITKINNSSYIPNISNFNIKGNHLTKFQIVKMHSLKCLDLSKNQLQGLGAMTNQNYPQLCVLMLTFNTSYIQMLEFDLSSIKNLYIDNDLFGQVLNLKIHAKILQKIQLINLIIRELDYEGFIKLKTFKLKDITIKGLDQIFSNFFPELTKIDISQHYDSDHGFNLPMINAPKLQQLSFYPCLESFVLYLQQSTFNHLQTLSLVHVIIQTMPNLNCLNLRQITISANELKNMKVISEWNLPLLQSLDLQMIAAQAEIYNFNNFPSLKILRLFGGCYNEEVFESLTIKQLFLQRVTGKNLPKFILPEVTRFQLRNCPFQTIKNLSFSEMNKLKILVMNSSLQKQQQQCPILYFPALEQLNINYNFFTSLMAFHEKSYPNLQQFSAVTNKITQVPIFNMPKLINLSLGFNNLQSVANLQKSNLSNLQSLNLNYNSSLATLPSLKIHTLQNLYIESCNFSNCQWMNDSELPNLKNLFIQQNPIQYFSQNKVNAKRIDFNNLESFNFSCYNLQNIDYLTYFNFSRLMLLSIVNVQLKNPKFPALNLQKLSTLQIRRTNIQDLSELHNSSLPFLSQLLLSQNRCQKLPKMKFPKLQKISANSSIKGEIYDNQKYYKIKSLQDFAISTLPSLKRLQLEDNSISKLPKFDFPLLQNIFIHNNNISDIEQFVQSQLPQLSLLNIENNPLNRFPFGQAVKPSQMYIKNAKIQSLSSLNKLNSFIYRLHYSNPINPTFNLPEVNFKKANRVQFLNCKLKNIDTFLKNQFPKIEEISFNDNEISHITKLNLPSLKRLHLKNNKLKDVKTLMTESNLQNIDIFTVQNNQIEDLVDFPFTNVKQAYFSHNLFSDISFMSKYTYERMQTLVLFDIKLKKLCKLNAPNLKKAWFNQNQISSIDQLKGSNLSKLQLINMCNNCIEDITVFQSLDLPCLGSLQLNDNKVQKFPKLKSCGKSLSKVFLQNNPVKNIQNLFNPKLGKHLSLYISLNVDDDNKYQELQSRIYVYYQFGSVYKYS